MDKNLKKIITLYNSYISDLAEQKTTKSFSDYCANYKFKLFKKLDFSIFIDEFGKSTEQLNLDAFIRYCKDHNIKAKDIEEVIKEAKDTITLLNNYGVDTNNTTEQNPQTNNVESNENKNAEQNLQVKSEETSEKKTAKNKKKADKKSSKNLVNEIIGKYNLYIRNLNTESQADVKNPDGSLMTFAEFCDANEVSMFDSIIDIDDVNESNVDDKKKSNKKNMAINKLGEFISYCIAKGVKIKDLAKALEPVVKQVAKDEKMIFIDVTSENEESIIDLINKITNRIAEKDSKKLAKNRKGWSRAFNIFKKVGIPTLITAAVCTSVLGILVATAPVIGTFFLPGVVTDSTLATFTALCFYGLGAALLITPAVIKIKNAATRKYYRKKYGRDNIEDLVDTLSMNDNVNYESFPIVELKNLIGNTNNRIQESLEKHPHNPFCKLGRYILRKVNRNRMHEYYQTVNELKKNLNNNVYKKDVTDKVKTLVENLTSDDTKYILYREYADLVARYNINDDDRKAKSKQVKDKKLAKDRKLVRAAYTRLATKAYNNLFVIESPFVEPTAKPAEEAKVVEGNVTANDTQTTENAEPTTENKTPVNPETPVVPTTENKDETPAEQPATVSEKKTRVKKTKLCPEFQKIIKEYIEELSDEDAKDLVDKNKPCKNPRTTKEAKSLLAKLTEKLAQNVENNADYTPTTKYEAIIEDIISSTSLY